MGVIKNVDMISVIGIGIVSMSISILNRLYYISDVLYGNLSVSNDEFGITHVY